MSVSDPIRRRTAPINGLELQVLEAGRQGDPLVILAHGFPESAYSWRHQLPALAAAGYHVIAPDQRGYGFSSKPTSVTDYGIEQLTGDLIELVNAAGQQQAVFVGHDWGALITWEVARLHPERTRAVVGISVPFTPWPAKPTEIFAAMFGDRFFYMSYFQPVGPAERELEADIRNAMRMILWGGSGSQYRGIPTEFPPAEGTGFLDVMPATPDGLPSWLTAADLDHYVEQFTESGFFGPVSYYRNLDANYEVLKDVPIDRVNMPSFFIGGECDAVIAGRPDYVDAMNGVLPGYRGKVMIPDAGHWTQQEAPSACNEALLKFLESLD